MFHKYRNQILLAAFLICIAGIIIYASVCSPQIKRASIKAACIELMQKVPSGYQDFEFWDTGTLRNNPDLTGMYEKWMERRNGYRDIISDADIKFWASGEALKLITGDLPLRNIRNRLSNDYYRDTGYPDSEVWTLKLERDNLGLPDAFVLEDGLVAGGSIDDIEDYLGVIDSDAPSFYNDDIAGIMERLPSGVMIRTVVTDVIGLQSITGMSVAIEEKGVYRWTNIMKFLDTEDVSNHLIEVYMESLENDFERAEKIYKEQDRPSPFRDFTLEQNGSCLKWSVLVEEDEMIALLFYG